MNRLQSLLFPSHPQHLSAPLHLSARTAPAGEHEYTLHIYSNVPSRTLLLLTCLRGVGQDVSCQHVSSLQSSFTSRNVAPLRSRHPGFNSFSQLLCWLRLQSSGNCWFKGIETGELCLLLPKSPAFGLPSASPHLTYAWAPHLRVNAVSV